MGLGVRDMRARSGDTRLGVGTWEWGTQGQEQGPSLDSPHLPTGMAQQLFPVPLDRVVQVEGDQGVQRGVGHLLAGDDEAPIFQ